jgi:hypothetical protein
MNRDKRPWDGIMEHVAESVVLLSDSEIHDEWSAAERQKMANESRDCLRQSVSQFRKRALHEAWQQYVREVESIRRKPFKLPKRGEPQRALLNDLFTRFPQVRSTVLTIQHREFRTLTDADVESYLRQLIALGVLKGE